MVDHIQVLVTHAYEYPKPKQSRHLISLLLGDGLLTAEGSLFIQV